MIADQDLHTSSSVGWLRCGVTAATQTRLHVTERTTMTRQQYAELGRKKRSAKRTKLGLTRKTRDVPRRIFSLRLAPTKEEKLYLQRAFGIACLAKRLAYKYLGDQCKPMTIERKLQLKNLITTEKREVRVYPEGQKQKGRGYTVERHENDFLPAKYRRRLFESHLVEQEAKARAMFQSAKRKWTIPLWRRPIPSDVRRNAVLQFCDAVKATQDQTEERAHRWDAKMEAHQRWLELQQRITDEEVLAQRTGERVTKNMCRKRAMGCHPKKETTSKHPPRGERPMMGPKQVKPTERTKPVQTIRLDPRSGGVNPFAASWFDDDGSVKIHGIGRKIRIWGSPSHRKRELRRLSEGMHDGERATRQQITIKYDHGRYYLQVQRLLPNIAHVRLPSPVKIVALDPGIRTFHGMADSEGRFGEIGEAQIERLIRVSKKADRIQSHIAKDLQGPKNKRKRHKAKRRMRQKNVKCRDLKSDGHWKAARALCESYDHVLIPKFHCRSMKRFLNNTATRQLVHWSHFQFRQRLKHKADELGVKVHEVSEAYTSMTCTNCLWIEESFRGNAGKTFECRKCGFRIDRDRNGARNILLMNAEKCVGRLEPVVEEERKESLPQKPDDDPVLRLLGKSIIKSESDDDDEPMVGWMWRKRKRDNTTAG